MLDFLGDVNSFKCRIERGVVHLGGVPLDIELDRGAADGPAAVYIRPHVLMVENGAGTRGSFPARVLQVNPAGPLVKAELVTPWGEPARVDMVRERYDPRTMTPGALVFLRPLSNSVLVVPGSADSWTSLDGAA